MKIARKTVWVWVVMLGVAVPGWTQMMGGGPTIPGKFAPVVGSGAQYEISTKSAGKMNIVYAIVGKESVDGADGFWLEVRMLDGKGAGMISKQLMAGGETPGIKRMIVQAPGSPPMEMPVGMLGGMMKGMAGHAPSGGGKPEALGAKVGTESITVPAGTFDCDHYQTKDARGTSDVWVSTKVSPYGMVKAATPDATMVLVKVLENETSAIKGEPQKFSFPSN